MKPRACAVLIFLSGLIIGGLGVMAFAEEPNRASAAVTGIGGVFFKADDPDRLKAWYRKHLGIDADAAGANFWWRQRGNPELYGRTVWAVFSRDSGYFGAAEQQWMVNYRVDDLDGLLARLLAQGVEQAGEVEEYWFGRFAWILDGEGNRVELWEPANLAPEDYATRLEAR